MLLVILFAFLPTFLCILHSRLISDETLLLQLKCKISPKENTLLNSLLQDPARSVNSFKASITRGRWNYSKYGFLQVNPFGASLEASFTHKSTRSWHFLCSALDDCLSSSFRSVQKSNCLLFTDSNQIQTQFPQENVSIDIFYALFRKMDFSAEEDAKAIRLLIQNSQFFEAKYISIQVDYSPSEGMLFSLNSLHQGEFALKWKDSPVLPLPELEVKCNHFLNPITWMHGEYTLNVQKTSTSQSDSLSITGLLPGRMHINWNKSNLSLEGKQVSIFLHCKFFPRQEAVQYSCAVPKDTGNFTLSLDYTVKMSHYSFYPFDANRGIDLCTPIIQLPDGKRVILQTLLLSLPQPDFSMPYNVMIICASISVIFLVSLKKALCKDPFAEHPILKKLRALKQWRKKEN